MKCPACGRPASFDDAKPNEKMCLPSNCWAWRITATYSHDERRWVPVEITPESWAKYQDYVMERASGHVPSTEEDDS